MIYQCYFRPEQAKRLFDHAPYRGFGLEPPVNRRIARRCPELANPRTRLFLTEYGAMLHIWRNNPFDLHRWIGFTSYRQLDKTPFRFRSSREVRDHLAQADIVGWGFHDVSAFRVGRLTGAAAQLEACHPGAMAYLCEALERFDVDMPRGFFEERLILFANYWVMPKRLFRNFMDFSWPILAWCLETAPSSAYAQSHPKSIGYVMERLFVVWYLRSKATLLKVGPHPVA